jgi:hypothetical protein
VLVVLQRLPVQQTCPEAPQVWQRLAATVLS